MRTASAAQRWVAGHDPVGVVPLHDPVVEALGYDPDSVYAETFWLPLVGPSALWAYRRLTSRLRDAPDGYQVDLGVLSAELGLGGGGGLNAPVVRTLARLVLFGFAEIRGDELAVQRRAAPLSRRLVQRLPDHLAEQHHAAMARS